MFREGESVWLRDKGGKWLPAYVLTECADGSYWVRLSHAISGYYAGYDECIKPEQLEERLRRRQ